MAPEKVLIDREKLMHSAQLTQNLHTNSYGGEAYDSFTQVNKAQTALGDWLEDKNLLKTLLSKIFPKQFAMLNRVNEQLKCSLDLSNRAYEKMEQCSILARALHSVMREYGNPNEGEMLYPPIIERLAQMRGVPPSTVTEMLDGEAIFINKEATHIWGIIRGVSKITIIRDRYMIHDADTATKYSFAVEPSNMTYILVRDHKPIPESLLGCTVSTAIDRQRLRSGRSQ